MADARKMAVARQNRSAVLRYWFAPVNAVSSGKRTRPRPSSMALPRSQKKEKGLFGPFFESSHVFYFLRPWKR